MFKLKCKVPQGLLHLFPSEFMTCIMYFILGIQLLCLFGVCQCCYLFGGWLPWFLFNRLSGVKHRAMSKFVPRTTIRFFHYLQPSLLMQDAFVQHLFCGNVWVTLGIISSDFFRGNTPMFQVPTIPQFSRFSISESPILGFHVPNFCYSHLWNLR